MITAMPRIAIAMATEDYDAAVALFRDGLDMPVTDLSASTVPQLGAHVGMCQPAGGSNIELMAPATPGQPLSDAIQRTLDRRGQGFYALMLEAPDPNAAAEALLERDVEVLPLMAGAGGRDIHPRSTHGVLMRIYPDGSVAQPDEPRSGRAGLSGIARAIVATSDAVKAGHAYGPGLGLEVDQPVDDVDRGVRSVMVTPPAGGHIELVSAIEPAQPFGRAIARQIEERGEGLHAIVLEADDEAVAIEALGDAGLVVGGIDGRETSVFGARVRIEQRSA